MSWFVETKMGDKNGLILIVFPNLFLTHERIRIPVLIPSSLEKNWFHEALKIFTKLYTFLNLYEP